MDAAPRTTLGVSRIARQHHCQKAREKKAASLLLETPLLLCLVAKQQPSLIAFRFRQPVLLACECHCASAAAADGPLAG